MSKAPLIVAPEDIIYYLVSYVFPSQQWMRVHTRVLLHKIRKFEMANLRPLLKFASGYPSGHTFWDSVLPFIVSTRGFG